MGTLGHRWPGHVLGGARARLHRIIHSFNARSPTICLTQCGRVRLVTSARVELGLELRYCWSCLRRNAGQSETTGTVLTWKQNKLFSTETCRSHALDKGWSLRGIVGYIIAKYNQFVVTAKCSCLLSRAFSNVSIGFF